MGFRAATAIEPWRRPRTQELELSRMTSSRLALAFGIACACLGPVGCSRPAPPPGKAPGAGAAAPAAIPLPAPTKALGDAAPLEQTTSEPALASLISAIGTGDVRQRIATLDAIAGRGPGGREAVEALLRTVGDQDPGIRWHAARALGMVGEGVPAAVPALASLLGDADPMVATQAAHAIGLVRGETPTAELPADDAAAFGAAVEPLINATLHADPRLRRAAIAALRTLATAEQLLPLVSRHLADADPSVVLPALHSLADMGADAVPFLTKALGAPGSRYWATVALAEMGPAAAPAVPQLTELARDAELDERLQAIHALASIGEAAAAAAPVLAEALECNEPILRVSAAYALGRIKAAAADEALARVAGDDNALLAEVAAWARARIHPDDPSIVATALERLRAGLKADEPATRAASVTGLSDLAPSLDATARRQLADALAGTLGDPDDSVSLRAGGALVQLGGAAIDALKNLLSDPAMRPRALEVLAAIGTPAATALPELEAALADTDPVVRSEAAFALASLGPDGAAVTAKLTDLLAEEQPAEVRYTAAYALGRVGSGAAAAFDRLVELSKAPDDLMATVAVWAALKIRPGDSALFAQAVPLLERALGSERELARLEAAVSLGEIGRPADAATAALEMVADNDPVEAVRDAATAALERIRRK
jgi:HEAT repeat protein